MKRYTTYLYCSLRPSCMPHRLTNETISLTLESKVCVHDFFLDFIDMKNSSKYSTYKFLLLRSDVMDTIRCRHVV